MVYAERFDACASRAFESLDVVSIGDNEGDRGTKPSVGGGIDQRLQVAAASRDQNSKPGGNGVGGHLNRTLSARVQDGIDVAVSVGIMPRRPRASTAGLFFHVVNRSAKRVALFDSAADYEAFERVLAEAVARHAIALFAYCLMPNHWHLLLRPQADDVLSRFMHWLTTTHARRWQTVRGLEGHGAVYQGRFKAIPIGSDSHFLWVSRYVERNPLRAGLVERAADWPWSSHSPLKRYEGWLSEWPVRRPADWAMHVEQPQTQAELDAFRKAMVRNEPYGSAQWRLDIQARMGTLSRGRRQ